VNIVVDVEELQKIRSMYDKMGSPESSTDKGELVLGLGSEEEDHEGEGVTHIPFQRSDAKQEAAIALRAEIKRLQEEEANAVAAKRAHEQAQAAQELEYLKKVSEQAAAAKALGNTNTNTNTNIDTNHNPIPNPN
jgi:hypothetical protein